MAPAHAPLASAASLEQPDVALTYTTATACTALPNVSESELLPPATPAARVRLEKTAAADGCRLRVDLTVGETGAAFDAFAVAEALDTNVAALSETARLRGAASLRELVLERVTLQVATKHYDVVLRGSETQPGSNLVLYGAKCSPQLQDEALVRRHVVPSGVDAGSLKIEQSDDIAVASGHALDCAAVLDVTARAPLLLPGNMNDALSYLRTLDANLDEIFEVNAHKRMVASVELHGPASGMLDHALLGQDTVTAAAAIPTESYSSPYNAPTKQMTMGILVGLVGLVAMLVAVAMKKRTHEKECAARYDNASKAAQIRRVSLRMSSPRRSRDAFGHEEEEEKEYEAYAEDDGLL